MMQGFNDASRWPIWLISIAAVVPMIGCLNSRAPSSIPTPTVDPSAAAARAIEQYDRNADGRLDETELAACPGLLAVKTRYDSNKDGAISADEIAAVLKSMYGVGVGLTSVNCTVLRGGQPLVGATVKFVPEPFLGGTITPAAGTTNANGLATVAIPDDQLPANQRGLRSMQPGIYRVEISHPSIKQPIQPQGCEVNPAVRGGTNVTIRLP